MLHAINNLSNFKMNEKSPLTKFHNCFILRDSNIIKEDLWIRNGKIDNPEEILDVENLKADVTVNCKGLLIAPGFIDTQINGAFGIDFATNENAKEGIQKVAKELLAHGVTSFCPTVTSTTRELYSKVLSQIKKRQGGKHGATIIGVHLEGPFINFKHRGLHPDDLVLSPEKGFESLREVYSYLDDIIILTIAPELPGAIEAIKTASKLGIKVSLGHSAACVQEGEEGMKCGANMITHLFNAMEPFQNRDPGLIGLLTSEMDKQVYYGIICDGYYTHPTALRMVYKINPKGLMLVSDAIPALGLSDGNYHIGPEYITVEGGLAYETGTKNRCGCTISLGDCVRNLKETLGCSSEYALEAASLHPARALGIDDRKGKLNYGYDADFVIVDPESLKVSSTWIAGECVFQRDNSNDP